MTPGKLITCARKYRYVRELQPNSSPEIDQWLREVGCKPGDSWCAAFVCAVIRETDPTFAFNKSASALHLLALNPHLIVTDPQPGDLIIHDHGHGLGHVGILTGTTHMDGKLTDCVSIAGNTSPNGASRNGTGVFEHEVSLENVAGYIRVCSQEVQ